jgi:glucose-1-phosphate thymidylyltransferase
VEARGHIAAGGEATRLGELTRVANKHLLAVGRWPMVYYPLQLMQLAGIREVLIVTGQGHAGQLIDLLGDGHMPERGSEQPMFDLDLTYKVQTEPGGIAQVVGMAEGFAGGGRLVVCLGDNLFEFAEVAAIREWVDGGDGAQIFVKEVPDPDRFGVVVYGEDGRVSDLVEKAGVVDTRYESPPTSDAVVGLYSRRGRLRRHPWASAVQPRRARDHRRQPRLRRAGPPRRPARAGLVADAGTHEALSRLGALVEDRGEQARMKGAWR